MASKVPSNALALSALAAALAAVSAACGTPPDSHAGTTVAALGESAPPLGSFASFAVLAGTTVTNTGPTTVSGDLGVDPGLAITGFPPGSVTAGVIHAGDATALQAQADVTTAYGVLAGEPCSADMTGLDLGGLTLVPGVYCFSSGAQLTGTLVLDAQGRADAVFVFKTVSTLITASNAQVRVINGGKECGVFWQIGSSATLGTGSVFAGSILALTSISLATGAKVSGRALARNGAVTMDNNSVSVGSCAASPFDAGAPDAAPIDSGTNAADAANTGDSASPEAGAVVIPDAAAVLDVGPVEVDSGASQDTGAADACCANTVMCGGACVDLTTDSNNCGACGNACPATGTCKAGVCCSN